MKFKIGDIVKINYYEDNHLDSIGYVAGLALHQNSGKDQKYYVTNDHYPFTGTLNNALIMECNLDAYKLE